MKLTLLRPGARGVGGTSLIHCRRASSRPAGTLPPSVLWKVGQSISQSAQCPLYCRGETLPDKANIRKISLTLRATICCPFRYLGGTSPYFILPIPQGLPGTFRVYAATHGNPRECAHKLHFSFSSPSLHVSPETVTPYSTSILSILL